MGCVAIALVTESTYLGAVELVELDWHTITVDEALQRLSVSPQTGLDTNQAQRRLQTYGKNAISPPKSNMLRKVLEWVLGGFGSLLLAASIVCFVAWYVPPVIPPVYLPTLSLLIAIGSR